MFEYFDHDNYSWNQTLQIALAGGGNINEIDEYCRDLKEMSREGQDANLEAWHDSWKRLGTHVESLALSDEEGGYYLSAGRKYLRACMYYIIAERNISNLDPRKLETYAKVLSTFKKGNQLSQEPVEWVEVPFEGSSLPSLFIPAVGSGPAPCMVHFDGFDITKEILYYHVGLAYRLRGVSLLIVDHPGVGEALRLRNMYMRYDTEVPAAACVDYLEGRPDVDAERIGINGPSLGSYYAPRAAAYEKRLKCCIAWGGGVWGLTLGDRPADAPSSVPSHHLLYVTGKDTVEEADEVLKKCTLEDVVDKITCPLLVVVGEADRFAGIPDAERVIKEAVNSPNRKLKAFMYDEGAVEHCGVDNVTMQVDYMADWAAEILGGNPKGL